MHCFKGLGEIVKGDIYEVVLRLFFKRNLENIDEIRK
jgi:hypothetical protein